jgi:N-ethylmaleimide reductase
VLRTSTKARLVVETAANAYDPALMQLDLHSPLRLGPLELPNRVFMAPLTRCRAGVEHLPNALMAEYYAQRASAGLIIAEATMIVEGNSAFHSEPGVHSAEQVAGWKLVTEAVHRQGGRIFLQLWHGGRACHPAFNDGAGTVAPSTVAIRGFEVHTPSGKVAHVVPRELADAELPGIVAAFAQAARNAREAGFDGVEIHGANGYLLDQFLRSGSNQRVGPYGGSVANRCRLLLEVVDAVSAAWSADRVGLRLSPLNSYNDMQDADPVGLATHLADALSPRGLAYLHLMRGDFLGRQQGDVLGAVRARHQGVLVANMGYTAAEANAAIGAGQVDAVAFGTSFLANPDLPARLSRGVALNAPDPATFYTPGPRGYVDYPAMATTAGA